MSYVPLWCKSNFSFLEGASHPEELVEEAHRFGLPALALTDRDGVYGVVRAHVKAREVGLKLIIGSEINIDDGSTVVLLTQDRRGYASLCRLITKGRLRSEKGESALSWDEICARRRLCELNVMAQVHAVREADIVRQAWRKDQPVMVHGWIYDLKEGLSRDPRFELNLSGCEEQEINFLLAPVISHTL